MQWFSVTMCYYGLSFASTSLSSGGPYLNYMLRWQSSENPTISKIKPDMEANNWSCFPQQCDDRDPWLPLLHLCHGLLGKETHPQLLSGCYQHSNKKVAISSFLNTDYIWCCLHLLWPLARTDWSRPQKSAGELLLVFKTHCSKELNEETSNLRYSSPSWASLGLPPPSPSSTSTLPSSFLQLWGSCFFGKIQGVL